MLIVYNTANDSRSVSGVLKHYLLMARAWISNGIAVDFLAARIGWPQIKNFVPEAGLISSDDLFHADRHIGNFSLYLAAYVWRLVTSYVLRTPRYDVVIASSPFIFEVVPALRIQKRAGAVLVAKFHHVVSAQARRKGLIDRLLLWSEKKSMRLINQHADVIIASTGPVARDARALERSLGLPERRIHQIGYGLDMSLFFPPAPDPTHDVVVLGRLHVHKGVLDLPEIWAGVLERKPDARLLIIGEGAHRPLVEEGFRARKISHSVTFAGGVPELEKNQLLAKSKIGLSLSFEEGWGLSVNEYLAAGLPAVVYDLPIYREVFPDLLVAVPQGDKQGIVSRITSLLDDAALRRQLGTRGHEFVRRYDYREIARAELEAMREAFSRKNRG